jgi:hypothetical protein
MLQLSNDVLFPDNDRVQRCLLLLGAVLISLEMWWIIIEAVTYALRAA